MVWYASPFFFCKDNPSLWPWAWLRAWWCARVMWPTVAAYLGISEGGGCISGLIYCVSGERIWCGTISLPLHAMPSMTGGSILQDHKIEYKKLLYLPNEEWPIWGEKKEWKICLQCSEFWFSKVIFNPNGGQVNDLGKISLYIVLIYFPAGITLVIMKMAWKCIFQHPHNEMKCVLSIKESYSKGEKKQKKSQMLMVRLGGVTPPLNHRTPPPYSQPDRKNVFLR